MGVKRVEVGVGAGGRDRGFIILFFRVVCEFVEGYFYREDEVGEYDLDVDFGDGYVYFDINLRDVDVIFLEVGVDYFIIEDDLDIRI